MKLAKPLTRRQALGCVLATFAASRRPAWAAEAPLRLALAPFLSPTALLTAFRPLREHLERTLARPVEMMTAKDFHALMEAAQRGDYDVVLLPAHLARMAMTDWRFEPVATPLESVNVVIAVKRDGGVRAAADLRGKTVGMLDALSLTATVGRRWLQEQGVAAEVKVLAMPSVNSGMFALDRGEIAAFVAADTQLESLPPATPRGQVVLATVGDIPGPTYVARPGFTPAVLSTLRNAMFSFAPEAGKPATVANSALRPVDAGRLARLDPLVAIARQAIAAGR